MSAHELARANGFAAEFDALTRMRAGLGDPQPSTMLTLPPSFRVDVLNATGDDEAGLDIALRELIRLVDAAPSPENEMLRLGFNFDREFGNVAWTVRVREHASNFRMNETTLRKKIDQAILQLLLRTRPAAEKVPDPPGTPAHHPRGTRTLNAADFFTEDYVRNSEIFVDAWSKAEAVDVCGFGHNRMVVSLSAEIGELLRSGGVMRVLLQDPEGRAVLDANFRSSTPKASEQDVRHQHRAGLATLSALRDSSGKRGRLLVKAYDILPPFTAYFFDPSSDHGRAFIWFWSWRQASSWRPGFLVERANDPLWFERFHAQFTSMWEDRELSQEIDLVPA